MSAFSVSNRKAKVFRGHLIAVPLHSSLDESGKADKAIWQLQDEVRRLQEELARTRRALEQREVLLRNSRQREIELRAEVGAGKNG